MDRRISKTEQAIQEAFFQLLKNVPADKITIKQLCQEANISRGTFYAHYEDYPAFLFSLHNLLIHRYMETFSVYHFDKNTEDFLQKQFETIRENRNLFSLLFLPGFDSVRDQCMQAEKELILPAWLSRSDISPEEAEVIFTFMIHGMFAIYRLWLRSDFSMDEKEIIQLMDNVGKFGVYHYIYKK